MSNSVKQYHKYVSIKKRNKTREQKRKKTTTIQQTVLSILNNPIPVFHKPSDIQVQQFDTMIGNVSNGMTQSVKGRVEHRGGKRTLVTKKDKIFSNEVPFGYTKKEYNTQLSKLKPPIIRATRQKGDS